LLLPVPSIRECRSGRRTFHTRRAASDLSQFGPNRGAIALDECRRIAPEIGSGFWKHEAGFKVVERTSCAQVDAGFPNALVGVKDVFE
jgi:hypothetical protein